MVDCPEVKEIYVSPDHFQYGNISSITKLTALKRLVVGEHCFVDSIEVDGERMCSLADWEGIEDIEIGNRCFMYYNSLRWSNMKTLKTISFGNKCFQEVYIFELTDLPSLETITIGAGCCHSDRQIRSDSLCRISNCPSLRHLEIGDYRFNNFLLFELSNLGSLHSIQIGDYCVANVSTFILNDLPYLKTVTIGVGCCNLDSAIVGDHRCRISNCPSLRHLEIGDYSFNTFKAFELENVNSLQKLMIGRNCFAYSDFSLRSMYIDRECQKMVICGQ